MYKPKNKYLHFGSILTLVSLYLLVLAGSIVRSTGSGMGCPDWPKCFGCWIPPTHKNQLPTNYQHLFQQKRIKKSNKIARILNYFGLSALAQKIEKRNNNKKAKPMAFNFTKAWIEYINRILGILVGLLISIVALLSWHENRKIRYLGLGLFLLVIMQGWLGSLVVATHLLPSFVTIHMLMALLIIACIISIIHANHPEKILPLKLKSWLFLSLLLTLIQIIWGTNVRAFVDKMIFLQPNWKEHYAIVTMGKKFFLHRSFSFIILLLNSYIIYYSFQSKKKSIIWGIVLLGIILINIFIGIILTYLHLPAWAQPLHLILATLLFSVQWYGYLSSGFVKNKII